MQKRSINGSAPIVAFVMRTDHFIAALATVIVSSMLFSLMPALAQACDEIDTLVTTTPAPPPDVNRWRRNIEKLQLAVPAEVDVVLIGDSLADAWDSKMWLPVRVVNLGVAGDGTQHVLWRLASASLSELKTREVLIILGTNNLSAGDQPCAIISGLIKIIIRVHAIWPSAQIGFLEIPPRG